MGCEEGLVAVQRRSRAHDCAEEVLPQGSEVIVIEADALQAVSHSLEISFVQACEAILDTPDAS